MGHASKITPQILRPLALQIAKFLFSNPWIDRDMHHLWWIEIRKNDVSRLGAKKCVGKKHVLRCLDVCKPRCSLKSSLKWWNIEVNLVVLGNSGHFSSVCISNWFSRKFWVVWVSHESRNQEPWQNYGKQGLASNATNYNCSESIADYSPLEPCGKCIWFYCSAASLVTGAPLLEVFSISSHNSSFHWNTDSSHLLGYHVPHRANLQTCSSVQQRFSNHFFDASSNCFRLPAPQPE